MNQPDTPTPQERANKIVAGFTLNRPFPYSVLTDEIAAAIREAVAEATESLRAERNALAAFKIWVHNYLDGKGIPTHPDGPHSREGCRIGDRMDLVFAEQERLQERVRRLEESLKDAITVTDQPLTQLPCGSPEMTSREYQIYMVCCEATGLLANIRRRAEEAPNHDE